MANDELGCCGYDELAEKPPTTEPFRPFSKMRAQNVWKNSEGSAITRRITPGSSMGSPRYVPFLGQLRLAQAPQATPAVAREKIPTATHNDAWMNFAWASAAGLALVLILREIGESRK